MKLIFAVVREDDSSAAVKELIAKKFGVTKLSSTGGFLKKGNSTLMIGTEDENVEEVMKILEATCAKREETEVVVPYMPESARMVNYVYTPIKVEVGGATVFVVDVAEFRKI